VGNKTPLRSGMGEVVTQAVCLLGRAGLEAGAAAVLLSVGVLRGGLSALPLHVFQTGPPLPFPPTHTKTHHITHFVVPREMGGAGCRYRYHGDYSSSEAASALVYG